MSKANEDTGWKLAEIGLHLCGYDRCYSRIRCFSFKTVQNEEKWIFIQIYFKFVCNFADFFSRRVFHAWNKGWEIFCLIVCLYHCGVVRSLHLLFLLYLRVMLRNYQCCSYVQWNATRRRTSRTYLWVELLLNIVFTAYIRKMGCEFLYYWTPVVRNKAGVSECELE